MSHRALSLPRPRGPSLLRLAPSGRSLVAATAVVLVVAGLYGLARETSMFAIRRIEVVGASPALAAQVNAELRQFQGTNLLRLNGAAVVRRADDLPAVFSATYDRAFPHTLRVRVVPELPIAVLRRGSEAWLVSARGRVIASVDRRRVGSLPRVWLPSSAQVDVGSILDDQAGGAAARALVSVEHGALAGRVAWGRIASGQFTAALKDGLELRFGPPADLRLKVAVAAAILRTLSPPHAGGPTYLDLSVVERPVAGRNPQPGGRG